MYVLRDAYVMYVLRDANVMYAAMASHIGQIKPQRARCFRWHTAYNMFLLPGIQVSAFWWRNEYNTNLYETGDYKSNRKLQTFIT